MVNQELIDLCRTVVAAIQDTDSFEKAQLRKLLLHIVPQLLTEIEILGGVLSSIRLPDPPEPASTERLEKAAEKVVAERGTTPGQKKSARKKPKKRRRK